VNQCPHEAGLVQRAASRRDHVLVGVLRGHHHAAAGARRVDAVPLGGPAGSQNTTPIGAGSKRH